MLVCSLIVLYKDNMEKQAAAAAARSKPAVEQGLIRATVIKAARPLNVVNVAPPVHES